MAQPCNGFVPCCPDQKVHSSRQDDHAGQVERCEVAPGPEILRKALLQPWRIRCATPMSEQAICRDG